MHSESDNIETMINDKADEIIEEHFESRLNRYQIRLETSMVVSDSIFDCVHLLYYKCHKIIFNPFAPFLTLLLTVRVIIPTYL